ncbi:MAG: hypothetical protein JW746_05440 [Candidatus Krumholzibacteriota bacterium]|nr:hypothetical protein [Candidatus Krumholzibacteriota bacterium]
MQVKCSLCGGENDTHPGQKMLFCTYCGSALAIGDNDWKEHLMLPHKRDDKSAKEALASFINRKNLAAPKEIKVEFAYIPYLMIEDDREKMRTLPAPGAPSWSLPLPFPPSGNYCFFDKDLAGDENIVVPKEIPEDSWKILHVPVYRIRYSAAGENYEAIVTGENLLVISEHLPPPKPSSVNTANIFLAAVLFVVFLFAGRFGSGFLGRLGYIMLTATLGFSGMSIWEKVRKSGK